MAYVIFFDVILFCYSKPIDPEPCEQPVTEKKNVEKMAIIPSCILRVAM